MTDILDTLDELAAVAAKGPAGGPGCVYRFQAAVAEAYPSLSSELRAARMVCDAASEWADGRKLYDSAGYTKYNDLLAAIWSYDARFRERGEGKE